MTSFAQCDEILEAVSDRANIICCSDTVLFLSMLRTFGFRSSEVVNIEKATVISGYILRVETNKGSDDRIIDFSMFGDVVDKIRTEGYKSVFPKCTQSYQSDFKRCLREASIRVGNKNISLHLYRHAKIKALFESGLSVQQIQKEIGIKSLAVVMDYVTSIIY
jgi:site-specific recombinase XerD